MQRTSRTNTRFSRPSSSSPSEPGSGGSPCTPLSGLRVRTKDDNFVRPDISILSGPPTYTANGRAVTNPKVVIEILSHATRDYDYGRKFALYRQMDSLAEYALVSQSSPLIEVYRRTPSGEWLLSSYRGLHHSIPFHSLNIEVPLAEIYAGVELTSAHDVG